jgi:hypothetical protein
MRTIMKRRLTAATARKELPAPLFQMSLREWQARYKTQRSTQARVASSSAAVGAGVEEGPRC